MKAGTDVTAAVQHVGDTRVLIITNPSDEQVVWIDEPDWAKFISAIKYLTGL